MTQPSGRSAAYLAAARSAVDLVARPEVAASWSTPSVLPDWTVGGLAAHLAGQVFAVTSTLAFPTGGAEPVAVLEHYQRVPWRGAALDEPANEAIRSSGDESAQAGPAELVRRAEAELAQLGAQLPTLPANHVVHQPWTRWALTLDDFLTTRLMEIAVHSDDLAVSVGIATPDLPAEVTRAVRHLLVDLAAQRHGDAAVLRALARAERSPGSIAAL